MLLVERDGNNDITALVHYDMNYFSKAQVKIIQQLVVNCRFRVRFVKIISFGAKSSISVVKISPKRLSIANRLESI